MNAREAAVVLAEIQATWPQRAIDEAQTVVWLETLATVESLDLARAARRRLKESLDWPPSHHEFLSAVRDERKATAQRSGVGRSPEPCRECDGDETVELSGSTSKHVPIVRPCSRCRPLQYQLWAGGHWMAGHSCSDCHDLRRGSHGERINAAQRLLADHTPVDLDPVF